jgi:hypothetical protein
VHSIGGRAEYGARNDRITENYASVVDWIWGISHEYAGPKKKIGDLPILRFLL